MFSFSGVPGSIRHTQAGLERVKGRLGEIEGSTFGINLGPLGRVTFKKNLDESRPDSHSDAQADGAAPPSAEQQ